MQRVRITHFFRIYLNLFIMKNLDPQPALNTSHHNRQKVLKVECPAPKTKK